MAESAVVENLTRTRARAIQDRNLCKKIRCVAGAINVVYVDRYWKWVYGDRVARVYRLKDGRFEKFSQGRWLKRRE